MDFLYHGLVGMAIAKETGSRYAIPSIVSAMLPDLLGIIPFYYFTAAKAWKMKTGWFPANAYNTGMSNTFFNAVDRATYRATHSIFAAGIIALLTYLLIPEYWLSVSLSYLSHILIDIPTHDGDFAQRIFYPFSDWHYPGHNWVRNRALFFAFWAALGLYSLIRTFL